LKNNVWVRIIMTVITGLLLAGCEGRMGDQINEELGVAAEAGEEKAAEDTPVKDEADQVVEDALLKYTVAQLIEPPELNIKIANGKGGGSSSHPKKN
jgi:hypothetical protein